MNTYNLSRYWKREFCSSYILYTVGRNMNQKKLKAQQFFSSKLFEILKKLKVYVLGKRIRKNSLCPGKDSVYMQNNSQFWRKSRTFFIVTKKPIVQFQICFVYWLWSRIYLFFLMKQYTFWHITKIQNKNKFCYYVKPLKQNISYGFLNCMHP